MTQLGPLRGVVSLSRSRRRGGASGFVLLVAACGASSPSSHGAETGSDGTTSTSSTSSSPTTVDATSPSDATTSSSGGSDSDAPTASTSVDGSGSSSGGEPPLDFCPTRIDVFGYSNVLFSGCGGANVEALTEGLFAPGTAGYDATLAGRLQARIMADRELTARFGTAWEVRSCSQGGGVMSTFVESHPDGECPMAGMAGQYLDMCRDAPAPMFLYSANNVFDRCHGGGSDTPIADDEATYAAHWSERLTAFIDDRAPALLLVSPQHEWHGQQGGSLEDPESCTWSRPAWNRSGAELWQSEHADEARVAFIGDLQDEFAAHHPCCTELGLACEDDWFAEGDGWVHFGCAGADALEELWFAALKATLLEHEFTCER